MPISDTQVSTDSNQQVLDLKRDALQATGVDKRHLHQDYANGGKGAAWPFML